MKILALVVLAALAAIAIYIRVAPTDPARWNVDPVTAATPGMSGWLLRDGDGNAPAPVLAAEPGAVLAALADIAAATPRTRLVAGSPEEGRMTWVTRSRIMGYPDYTTAAALPVPGGTALVVLARQRFGSGDWGVNRARVEDWLARLDLAGP